MRSLLIAAALGIGLISGTAEAAPVIGAAPVTTLEGATMVQYRHHPHHRPHYRPHHHHRHYAPPPRHYHPRPHHHPHYRHHGWRHQPPRYYGWR